MEKTGWEYEFMYTVQSVGTGHQTERDETKGGRGVRGSRKAGRTVDALDRAAGWRLHLLKKLETKGEKNVLDFSLVPGDLD